MIIAASTIMAGILSTTFIVLWKTNSVFKHHAKFAIYYMHVFFSSILLIPFLLFRPGNVRNLLIVGIVYRQISRILGIQWRLRGKEYLEKDEAVIIIANHQSSLDMLGLQSVYGIVSKGTVAVKNSLLLTGPSGVVGLLGGVVFLPRNNTNRARQILHDATQKMKNERIKMWMFPEGKRRNTGEIHAFKKGGFYAAIESKIPILPLVFSRYYFLDDKRFDSGIVYLTALPPISTENLTADDVDSLIEQTRNLMIVEFEKTNKEVAGGKE